MLDFILCVLAFLVIALIVDRTRGAISNRFERDGKWHPTPEGKMRQYVDGQWRYREMTEEESDYHLSSIL